MQSSSSVQQPVPHIVKTPFDAQYLRTLRGHDGQLYSVGGDEARLTFSLCIDFFATEGMHVRGPSTSLGIIALACLELPVEIRYKPEHMFLLGIIPGPSEPSLTELNHYIDPLVTDMLGAWHNGLRLSRTALKPDGRLARAAIAIVVCDLPSARKTAQLSPSTSKIFCSVCDCWDVRDENGKIIKNWKDLRGRHDCERWHRRDVSSLRSAAERWRDASSSAERKEIFEEHGVRWSPLWRLPYWDPSRQLVVDSMHCLLEGLVKFHCLQALRLTEKDALTNVRPPAFAWDFTLPDKVGKNGGASEWTEKEIKDIEKIHLALVSELQEEEAPGKGDIDRFAAQLERYLAKRGHRPLTHHTVTPSWVSSVPRRFGAAAVGTPKADEWRTVFTLYLPITMIFLFAYEPCLDPQFTRILNHTMQLVCAVTLACKRTTTARRIARYRDYLTNYIRDLRVIFPHLQFESIHHMSFHIPDFLELFGPVHSWWCFPFERLIGQLQRLPTNHRFGELERSIHRAFL
ncbi:hypothetical protein C8Q76DRAFT_609410, partial [Earliella scabrosa]